MWVQQTPGFKLMPEIMRDDLTVAFATPSRGIGETTKSLFATIPAESIRDITISERSLEDVFTEIYQQSASNEAKSTGADA
jgi:hypothetical protein